MSPSGLERLRRRARGLLPGACRQGCTTLESWGAGPELRDGIRAAQARNPGAPVVLGRIDHDGRAASPFGPLPDLPGVDEPGFIPRKRFDLDLVLEGAAVLLRKSYRDDEETFLHEWITLAVLSGKASVPVLHHVDEPGLRLYRNLIPGKTIRELLVAKGARILTLETDADPALAGLSGNERIEAVWARGRAVLRECVPGSVLARMRAEVRIAHRMGVLGVSHTYGNVVLEAGTGRPWFIDLDKARLHRVRFSPVFLLKSLRERRQFDRIYGPPC